MMARIEFCTHKLVCDIT